MLKGFTLLSRALGLAGMSIAAICLVLMTAAIGWQVFARYVLQNTPAWAEQAALVLMMWFILLGAAVGVREQFHIRVSAATDAMPAPLARACRFVALLVLAAFGLSMAIYGGDLVARTWAHQIPALPLPRGAAYLPLPIGGALIVLFTLEWVIAEIRRKPVEPLWN